MDIGDLYRAVACRWRMLAPALALTFSLAGLYIFSTPPRYAANMSLLVDTRERPPVGVDAQPIAQNPDAALIESQMRVLTSNEVLRRTVDNERLRFDPDFAPAKPSAIVAAIRSRFSSAPQQSETMVNQIVEALGKSITTKRSAKSYVINVEVTAARPEKAERLARALANAYFEMQSKMGDDIAEKETDWLDKKIADLRNRLDEAERHVEDYRKSKSILVTDGHVLPEQQLKDANTALIETRGKRAELEAKYAQLQAAIRSSGSIETLNEAVHSPLIEKLRGDYATLSRDAAYVQSTLGPRHPSYGIVVAQIAALRAQITAEMRRIASAQAHDLKAARNAEQAAEQLVADLQKSINNLGPRRIELNELERQSTALRERYEKALAARENVHPEVVSSPNGVLIDQPIAQKGRVSPKTQPALIIALAGGLNLWIAAALISEYLARKGVGAAAPASPPPEEPCKAGDASGKTKQSKWRFDGAEGSAAPIVFPLPRFDQQRPRSSSLRVGDAATLARAGEIMETPREPYRRAIARLYDALWTNAWGRGALVIATAAREKGAGTSTAALSLALFACSRGDHVLLLDGNLEHSTLASALPQLTTAKQRFGFDYQLFVYRRDSLGINEILLTSLDGKQRLWPTEPHFKLKFDLIIVDSGVLTSAPSMLVPAEEIDAVIMIERNQRSGERLACLLFGRSEQTDAGTLSRRVDAATRMDA